MTPREELEQVETEIKRLEERKRQLYERSSTAPENEKLCEDNLARLMAEPDLFPPFKYPIEVGGITFRRGASLLQKGLRKRELVRIRPCDPALGGKTFLGLYLGDMATRAGCSFNRETEVLEIYVGSYNPAIWIPSLQRIVFGFESWWGAIETEEQLAEITDDSIGKIWYVQAMKAMLAGKETGPVPDAQR